MNPIVSVLLPVYNAEAYVAEAIESILNQTFHDFELLIINDGSSDHSLDIINSFKDERIRVVNNETNLKLIGTLNKGIDLVRGKYLARMDADDISMPTRLEQQVGLMENNFSLGVCSSWFESFGASNEAVKYPRDHDAIMVMLLYQNALCHAAAMFRMDFLKQIDFKYSTRFVHAEDLDTWVRLADKTKFANIEEVLYRVRMHKDSVSITNKLEQQNNTVQILKMQFGKLGMQLSDDDVSLFRDIAYAVFKADKNFIIKSERLLSGMLESNQKSKFISQSALESFVFEKWLHLCYNTTSLGKWVYDYFYQSSFARLMKIPVMHKLKFRIKANFRLS